METHENFCTDAPRSGFKVLYFVTVPGRTCVSQSFIFYSMNIDWIFFHVFVEINLYSSRILFLLKSLLWILSRKALTTGNASTTESCSQGWWPRKFLNYWMWWRKSLVYECSDNESFLLATVATQQSRWFMFFGIASFFFSFLITTKYVLLNISKLNNLFLKATTPNCLAHETDHWNFMLMSKGKTIYLFLRAASVVCLLIISSPPFWLMTASAEYFSFH